MRIGDLAEEFVILERDAGFILTAEDIIGTVERASMTMKELPGVVKKDNTLFINDGLIELRVEKVKDEDVFFRNLL